MRIIKLKQLLIIKWVLMKPYCNEWMNEMESLSTYVYFPLFLVIARVIMAHSQFDKFIMNTSDPPFSKLCMH